MPRGRAVTEGKALPTVTFDIQGLGPVRRALKKLPKTVQRRIVRGAIRDAAKPIQLAARRNLPAHYRTLRKSLWLKVLRQRYATFTIGYVGPRVGKNARYDGWYGHIVERGADPHPIKVKKKKVLVETFRSARSGGIVYGRIFGPKLKHGHPGVEPRPFLGPAFRSESPKSFKKFAEFAEKRLAREVAKIAAKRVRS